MKQELEKEVKKTVDETVKSAELGLATEMEEINKALQEAREAAKEEQE